MFLLLSRYVPIYSVVGKHFDDDDLTYRILKLLNALADVENMTGRNFHLVVLNIGVYIKFSTSIYQN